MMALFNVAACIGWSCVNAIVGGQLVGALSGGAIPPQVGILIITILTTIFSIYGYKYIHRYERYAWIPVAAIFLTLLAVSGPKIAIVPTPAFTVVEIASFISFGGAVFGFAIGWSSYAADYNMNQPENTRASNVFLLTFLGVAIPCIVLEIFGLALTFAYKNLGGGDLLASSAKPLGSFGFECCCQQYTERLQSWTLNAGSGKGFPAYQPCRMGAHRICDLRAYSCCSFF